MISLITRTIRALFMLFLLLAIAPTLIFLVKWHYRHLLGTKTYIGVLELPYSIKSSSDIIASAKTLFSSPDIRAVIIKTDGNGGDAGICQCIHLDLIKLKNQYNKPLIAYCGKECFAGSYFIASAADSIVSTPGALIGYLGKYMVSKKEIPLSENITIDIDQKNLIQHEHREQYANMLVNARKNLTANIVHNLYSHCQTGLDCLKIGLVDIIGGTLEIEKILQGRIIVTGKVEYIHGSLLEHFVMFFSSFISQIVEAVKLAS